MVCHCVHAAQLKGPLTKHERTAAKQSMVALSQVGLLVKGSSCPHHLLLLIIQPGFGDVGGVLVVGGLVVVVGGLEVGVEVGGLNVVDGGLLVGEDVGGTVVLEEEGNERYQFDLSVSPRHSPTVTPFHPLALIKP